MIEYLFFPFNALILFVDPKKAHVTNVMFLRRRRRKTMTSISEIPVQKWHIVLWAAFVVFLMVAGVVMVNGFGETGMRIVIRLTARSSCLLFLFAFLGSTLAALWPSVWTQWLRTNRRYFGLSFAISHAWHAIAILGLMLISSGQAISYSPGGMLGYVFIALMTATSSDRALQWLGDRKWYILHTVGAYYIWLAFIVTFGKKCALAPIYPFMTGLLVIAMGLRIGNSIRRRIAISS
jgi:methionine sulfoxide reductase heme-binding subunit